MISSHEEFSLLLNKWRSESKEVFVSVTCQEPPESRIWCSVVAIGSIRHFDVGEFAIADANGNTALVRYSNCRFVYEAQFESRFTTLAGKKFEDVFVLVSPSGTYIAVGSTDPLS
jgi:hypothetical protein